jgi:hypothetical protein
VRFCNCTSGWHTTIGDYGEVDLSDGQTQRLSIARGLVGHPALLLMDECVTLFSFDILPQPFIVLGLVYFWSLWGMLIDCFQRNLASADARPLVLIGSCLEYHRCH